MLSNADAYLYAFAGERPRALSLQDDAQLLSATSGRRPERLHEQDSSWLAKVRVHKQTHLY